VRPDAESDDRVAALLRDRLRAADEEIETPPGLWENIQSADAARRRRSTIGPRLRLGWAVAAAAALVCAVALGAWWLVRPTAGTPAGPRFDVTVTVFNAEEPCRSMRTMECALRLAKDPYAEYAAPGNSAGRVWHGDRLSAACVVTRGTLVEDESGVTSTRWYLVRAREGVEGWLPGVRTRNSAEVPTCSAAEVRNSR
jgi:hypothetical protein